MKYFVKLIVNDKTIINKLTKNELCEHLSYLMNQLIGWIDNTSVFCIPKPTALQSILFVVFTSQTY